MALGIAPEIIAEFQKDVAFSGLLLELQVSPSTLYFTDINAGVNYGGHTYTPLPFKIPQFSKTTGMKSEDITLTIDNASLIAPAVFLNQENRYKTAIVTLCCFDQYGRVISSGGAFAAVEIYKGQIASTSLPDKASIEISLTGRFADWNKTTLLQYDYVNFKNLEQCENKTILWGRTS